MKKNVFVIIVLFPLLFINCTLFSQRTEINRYMIVRSTPKYTLSININTNQSILELSGTYNDDVHSLDIYNGETFGADKGFGGYLISKISLGDKGKVRFYQSLSFNRILSYTFGTKDNLFDQGSGKYNAYSLGLGLEYNFTPAHMFKIYAGGEINASIINGKIAIWFYSPIADPVIINYTVKNSFRIGYGVNIGSEYLVNRNFGLHLGVRLQNLNGIIKSSKGTNAETEFELRDADNPGLNFAGRKNFSFYSILGGVNFYFGIGEKRYKLK